MQPASAMACTNGHNGSVHSEAVTESDDDADLAADSEFEPVVVCGLRNIGNTCYFNSGLQCLVTVPQLVSAVRWLGRSQAQTARSTWLARGSPACHALTNALTATIAEMSGASETITPLALLRSLAVVNPQFEGLQQQDCPEMVSSVLGALEDNDLFALSMNTARVVESFEATPGGTTPSHRAARRAIEVLRFCDAVNRENDATERRVNPTKPFVPPVLTRSATHDIFKGLMLSETTCARCGTVGRCVDAFASLTVAIPTTKQRRAFHAERKRKEAADAAAAAAAATAAAAAAEAARTRQASPRTSGGHTELAPPLSSPGKGAQSHASRNGTSAAATATAAAPPAPAAAAQQPEKPKRTWNPFVLLARCIAAFCRLLCGCCCGGGDSDLGPLTLEECLAVHFSDASLRGTNRYHCDTCNAKTEAARRERILDLPEVLIVHLKRFDFGTYWTQKIHDHVVFPMDVPPPREGGRARAAAAGSDADAGGEAAGAEMAVSPRARTYSEADSGTPASLDLRSFLVGGALCAPGSGGGGGDFPPLPAHDASLLGGSGRSVRGAEPFAGNSPDVSRAAVNGRNGAADPPPAASPTARTLAYPCTTTYSLQSVVSHHGSFGGGHYTAYTNKGARHGWALFNDHRVARASHAEVASTQAYLLVYRRQRVDPRSGLAALPSPAERALAVRARLHLLGLASDGEGASPLTPDSTRYVSRLWLHRLATFVEPGPIANAPCFCAADRAERHCFAFGDRVPEGAYPTTGGARHVHCATDWFYVPVPMTDWAAFLRTYGGGPEVGPGEYRRLCDRENGWIRALIAHTEAAPAPAALA